MKLTFRAALHFGLAMLWQLFHNYSLSFLSVGIANDLSNCLAMLWQQFHFHHPSFLSASPMTNRTACPMTQIAVRVGLARTLLFRINLFVGPAMLWQLFHIHHPAQFWSASPCNFGFQSHITHSTLARHRHWPFKLSVGHSSFSPAVVLALLRLPFSASFSSSFSSSSSSSSFSFFFFFFFFFIFSSSVSSYSASASSSTSSSCCDCSCCCCGCC